MGTRSTSKASFLALASALAAAPAAATPLAAAPWPPTDGLRLETPAPRELAARPKRNAKGKGKGSAGGASAADPLGDTGSASGAAGEETPADPLEPALPSSLPSPVHCPAEDAEPGKELVLRCAVRPALKPTDVTIYYRTGGQESFERLDAKRSRRGWWSAKVPASATAGKSIQFYAEALQGIETLGTSGDAASPNIVVVRRTGAARADEPDFGPRRDEAPLAEQQAAADAAKAEAARLWRAPKTIWIGLGIGSGYGWHGERELDRRSMYRVKAGASAASVFHLLPEVGYQLDERHSVSIQSRHQHIPDEGEGDGSAGPPRWSHLVLIKGYRSFTEGALQLFATGTVGGGSGFRLVVPPDGPDLLRTDTLRGGPIVLGPGGGVMFYFLKQLAATAEARVLAGLPDFALLGELNLGLQYGF